MNILAEFFFGPQYPKRISPEEFEKLRVTLYGELERDEWSEVEMLFHGALNEHGNDRDIDRDEYEYAIAWLRDNSNRHSLEASDIERLKHYCEQHLQD